MSLRIVNEKDLATLVMRLNTEYGRIISIRGNSAIIESEPDHAVKTFTVISERSKDGLIVTTIQDDKTTVVKYGAKEEKIT